MPTERIPLPFFSNLGIRKLLLECGIFPASDFFKFWVEFELCDAFAKNFIIKRRGIDGINSASSVSHCANVKVTQNNVTRYI